MHRHKFLFVHSITSIDCSILARSSTKGKFFKSSHPTLSLLSRVHSLIYAALTPFITYASIQPGACFHKRR